MRTAKLLLAAEARSAGLARRFLSETLAGWSATRYSDAATLVLSELVTNAALHARTEMVVQVSLSSSGLRLEVSDTSNRRPMLRHYSAEATTGRGLGMVNFVAQSWGVVPRDVGKTVWAELVDDQPEALPRPDRDLVADLAAFPDLEAAPGDPTMFGGPSALARNQAGWAA